jgi:hypothetical protein
MPHHDDRGQVAPLLALFAVAIGVACLLLGRFGGEAVDRARVRTAADAAALAGAATRSEDTASDVAARNGGRLESFEQIGSDVRVRVALGSGSASARARRFGASGDGLEGAGAGGQGGLAPALRAALARAGQLLGQPVPITSGARTTAEQRRLYDRRAASPYPVAPPGSSMHERGLAVDVPSAFADRLAAVAGQTGLCRPYPRTDPVHFELCGGRFGPKGPG